MGIQVTFENLRTLATEDLQAALKGSKGQIKAEIKRELLQRVEDAKAEAPAAPQQEVQPEVQVPDAPAPEAPAPEQAAPTPVVGPVLHVKQGMALRGGRGEWYKLLCKYDGKPVAEYIAEGKANPASHYTARSTKCGQPKTPESRLSWFKRAGIVTIS